MTKETDKIDKNDPQNNIQKTKGCAKWNATKTELTYIHACRWTASKFIISNVLHSGMNVIL